MLLYFLMQEKDDKIQFIEKFWTRYKIYIVYCNYRNIWKWEGIFFMFIFQVLKKESRNIKRQNYDLKSYSALAIKNRRDETGMFKSYKVNKNKF